MLTFSEQYDVVVIGAGHAGCEVEALASVSASGSPLPKS